MAYRGLLVGLGNPGKQYEYTRHNLGFSALLSFCKNQAAEPLLRGRKSAQALLFDVRFGSDLWLSVCPQTFMNRSGLSVAAILRNQHFLPEQILVIHDELDLPLGTVRLKRGGGLAGHNGLRSIADALGSRDFLRLRLGIGRPVGGSDVADYVLAHFRPEEKFFVQKMLADADFALQKYLENGIDYAMQLVHTGV